LSGSAVGLDPARALDPAAFAIEGRVPGMAVRPASREELSECLAAATRERLAVVPWGGGTTLRRGAPPERYDLAVDVRGLDRVVEFDPEDLTITVECGITLEALAGTLADRGQELPIEGAGFREATLGGALATNSSGPRRLTLGSPRDRILGARFAQSDGTLARSGGKVVKNVAGYGIHRLLCGSRGALAALVEVSLKLLPAPETRRALVFAAPHRDLIDSARWAFLTRAEPASLVVIGPAAAARARGLPASDVPLAIVLLEDDAARVDQLSDQAVSALGEPLERLDGDRVVELERTLCDAAESPSPRLEWVTPWNSPAALGVLVDASAANDFVFYAPAGRLHLVPSYEDPAPIVRRLAGAPFVLVEAHGFDRSRPRRASFAAITQLRRRIRSTFDTTNTWALGPEWEGAPEEPAAGA
jgi:glycolate oxidase FAD binding subunit